MSWQDLRPRHKLWTQYHKQGQQHVYASSCGAEKCVRLMICAEYNGMESMDSDVVLNCVCDGVCRGQWYGECGF